METQKVVKLLTKLIQLDIDAVHAYEHAIAKVDKKSIHDQLVIFKSDHRRHIEELSQAVKELGHEPPENKPDLKGLLIEGFTAIRSVTGTQGALSAMRTNENLTTKTYEEALKNELPSSVRDLIYKNYQDEKRHLYYIESTLVLEKEAVK